MKFTFYLKLALTNLKKNRETYFPYFLACLGTIFMYFLFVSFAYNEGLQNISGRDMVYSLFLIGKIVVIVFAVIFIFYANSFLMKRRKKEIGLYSILGLEKRQISAVMFFESLLMAAASLIGGLLFGSIFGNLLFRILMRLINTAPDSTFILNPAHFAETAIFFGIVFLFTFLFNDIQVRISKPISLLKSANEGEKEPKSSIIITLIGLVSLGYGYYIALTEESILLAIIKFWGAVILVIIGTHALFTSGSIFILKTLKRNRRFYYNPNNFISISNLIYRMKKNAAGLANICILSTMILVTVSTTIALYAGKEDMLRARNPRQLAVTCSTDAIPLSELSGQMEEYAEKHNVTLVDAQNFSYTAFNLMRIDPDGGTSFETTPDYMLSYSSLDIYYYEFTVILLDDYNRMEGTEETLEPDEIILFSKVNDYGHDTLTMPFATFRVKEEVDELSFTSPKADLSMDRGAIIVVDSRETLDKITESYMALENRENLYLYTYNRAQADLKGDKEDRIAFIEEYREAMKEAYGLNNSTFTVLSYDLDRIEWNELYGGFLFLGVALGLLFLMAMVLIIYFKQVSEGYEDRNRFEVLQKVGMDKRDIRRTINKQLRLVFFLPLIGALIHLAVAFRILRSLLAMFQLERTGLIVLCFVAVSAVFSVIYFIVYQLTSKIYYKIVNR